MALVFLLIMGAAVTYAVFGRKAYTSEAKLFVRLGRESVTLDPTATTGQVITVQESREGEINSICELLRSRGLLESVVTAVGPEALFEKDAEEDDSPGPLGFLNGLQLFGPYSKEDAALRHLAKHLSINVIKKTNVLNLSYEAKSPDWAQSVLANFIELAREAHIRVNRTQGSQEFFTAQSERLGGQLTELEEKLRDLKNSSGLASLDDQRLIQLKRIGELEDRLLKTEAELSVTKAQTELQQKLLGETDETIVTAVSTGMPHSTIGAMREQLYTQEAREQELLAKYTERHWAVRASQDQMAELRNILRSEPAEPQVTRGRNPAYEDLSLSLVRHQVNIASLQAESTALTGQLVDARSELKRINENEVQLVSLQRQIDLEQGKYKKYAENLEQARIDHELELQSISNLNVLQEPSRSLTPSRPRPVLSLALGLVAAIFGSAGIGLLLEIRRGMRPARPVASGNSEASPAGDNGRQNGHYETMTPVAAE